MAGFLGPGRENRGVFGGFRGHAESLQAATAEQAAAVAAVKAVVNQGYGTVSPRDIAVGYVNPTGRHYITGGAAVREDYEAAVSAAEKAVQAEAIKAQIVGFDGRLRLDGAGGWAVLDQFVPGGNIVHELTRAEKS